MLKIGKYEILFLTLLLISCNYCERNIDVEGTPTTKILFIGSSYFRNNDLPGLVNNLAICDDKDVLIDSRIIGGTYLQYHANNIETQEKINSETWDYVILQGVGRLMAYPEIYTDHPVYPSLEKLRKIIYTNSNSTKMVFCLPWAYEDGMTWLEGWTDGYSDMQNKINNNTLKYAKEIGFTIAPVGIAWQEAIGAQDEPMHYLHSSDYNHPSIRGSYLMACVIYATVFQKSLVGIPYYSDLSVEEAQYFQSLASSTVLNGSSGYLN